ncbi:hypothetical protein GO730_19415 [Spirosoma sp. HMF3257]|uniref:Uncharacterized protein n=1 Tax=Spirosoma telluris TaxID=2183553 RepID=A0A327NLV8_9BACT|nr:hypothetical protein [Spirosoma telluris]RAI75773.1 hypothetical protein HMF3257_19345 [Spirosoma telluris]
MLPNWEERPVAVAHLLNPAFCGEVIKRCITEFQKIDKIGLSFQLSFLILPIILNKDIRESLPKTSGKNFITWIEENQILKQELPILITNVVPYTKEALMFLLMYKIVKINDKGYFESITKNKPLTEENEVVECYKKAELLGKLFAKAGASQLIFISLGIKP